MQNIPAHILAIIDGLKTARKLPIPSTILATSAMPDGFLCVCDKTHDVIGVSFRDKTVFIIPKDVIKTIKSFVSKGFPPDFYVPTQPMPVKAEFFAQVHVPGITTRLINSDSTSVGLLDLPGRREVMLCDNREILIALFIPYEMLTALCDVLSTPPTSPTLPSNPSNN